MSAQEGVRNNPSTRLLEKLTYNRACLHRDHTHHEAP
jgi:hypothetical protein